MSDVKAIKGHCGGRFLFLMQKTHDLVLQALNNDGILDNSISVQWHGV